MSDEQCSDGLANSSGLVGKNLMMHPCPEVEGVYEDDLESWNGPAGQLAYSLQFYETDLDRGFYRGAKWALMPFPGALRVLRLFDGLPFEERWGTGLHQLSSYAGKAFLWSATVDDLPEESNRVILDDELTDSSGLPAPRIQFRYSEDTLRNIEFQYDRMVEAHEAAGAAHIFRGPIVPSGHLLGTARMGDDPQRSVVDGYGRCHDVPNLFIVDGSVMVTGGAVNPTATIAAFALAGRASSGGNRRPACGGRGMTALALETHEVGRLRAVAAVLVPGDGDAPAALDLAEFDDLLQRAATALGPDLPALREAIRRLPEDIETVTLTVFSASHPEDFSLIGTAVSGAYFMSPTALTAIGYPTGPRTAPPFDLAADELASGILDPVIPEDSMSPEHSPPMAFVDR